MNIDFIIKQRNIKIKIFISIIFIFVVVFISIFLAFRDDNFGRNTDNYIAFYYSLDTSRIGELIFIYLAKVTMLISTNYKLFFFVVSFISIVTYVFFIYKVSSILKFNLYSRRITLVVIIFSLSLFSLFFWNAQISAIRSGLSIPFLFLSLYYIYFSSWRKFVFFYSLSVLSHFSVLIFLPFILLFYFKNQVIFMIYIFLSLIYLTGITEKIFYNIATLFYQLEPLSYYLQNAMREGAYKSGVRLDFFIFTTFFYYLLYLIQKNNQKFDLLYKIYSILIFPFLLLGFINHSDRLLLAAWNMIPIIIGMLFIYKIKYYKEYFFISILFLFISVLWSLWYRELLIFQGSYSLDNL